MMKLIQLMTGPCAIVFAGTFAVPACAYEEGPVTGGGSITGKVVFNGTPGTRKVIPTRDLEVCGGPYEETLIQVGPDKSVHNAVVYLVDIAKGKAWPAQAKPPEINNTKCKFEPHIQVVRVGKLDVANSDPMLHNTHGYYGRRTAFNLALPNEGQRIPVDLTRPGESASTVTCMAGWRLGSTWLTIPTTPSPAPTANSPSSTFRPVPTSWWRPSPLPGRSSSP